MIFFILTQRILGGVSSWPIIMERSWKNSLRPSNNLTKSAGLTGLL